MFMTVYIRWSLMIKDNDIILRFLWWKQVRLRHAVLELNKDDKGNRKFIIVANK